MSRTIPLTRGYVAIVDDEDYEWLSGYYWRLIGTQWVYAETRIPGVVGRTGKPKSVLMHRLILDLVDEPSHVYSDHINGDTLDNRRQNLRVTDNKGNQGNRHANSINASSQYRGVVWNKVVGKWMARIRIDRHLFHIGVFDDEVDAALAYDIAARLHFGEFAALNLPERQQHHALFFLSTLAPKNRHLNPVPGVSQLKSGKWRAYVHEDKRYKHLGNYDTPEEAGAARAAYLNTG